MVQSELGYFLALPYNHRLLRRLPQTSPAHYAALYTPPDPQDVLRGVTVMILAAAPGPDGVTVNLHKVFWDLLGPVLCAVVCQLLWTVCCRTRFGRSESCSCQEAPWPVLSLHPGDRLDC